MELWKDSFLMLNVDKSSAIKFHPLFIYACCIGMCNLLRLFFSMLVPVYNVIILTFQMGEIRFILKDALRVTCNKVGNFYPATIPQSSPVNHS